MPANRMPHLSWKVDHENKIIWLTVRLALYRMSGRRPSAKDSAYIEGFTGGHWQDQLKFACYGLRIIVQCRGVSWHPKSEDDGPAVGSDEFPVRIDWSGPSEVKGYLTPKLEPLSDSPKQLFVPTEGHFNPQENAAWQHELGHILGLDDGYVDVPGKPLVPGHPADIMWQNQLPVSPETVTKMVRRNGAVDESALRCSLSFDATPGDLFLFLAEIKGLTVHAWSCRWIPVSSDPAHKKDVISFEGTASFAAGYLMGKQNAAAREFIEALTGVPTDPLADDFTVKLPITFTIGPGQFQLLSIKAGKGVLIEGEYSWNAATGLPVLHGPLRLNGLSTGAFFPGPPVQGYFLNGAKECSR